MVLKNTVLVGYDESRKDATTMHLLSSLLLLLLGSDCRLLHLFLLAHSFLHASTYVFFQYLLLYLLHLWSLFHGRLSRLFL